jgi:hypothetical protein
LALLTLFVFGAVFLKVYQHNRSSHLFYSLQRLAREKRVLERELSSVQQQFAYNKDFRRVRTALEGRGFGQIRTSQVQMDPMRRQKNV